MQQTKMVKIFGDPCVCWKCGRPIKKHVFVVGTCYYACPAQVGSD